jgi:hypothetical protein
LNCSIISSILKEAAIIFSIRNLARIKTPSKVEILINNTQSVFEAYPKWLSTNCRKKASEINWTKNRIIVNPLIRWLGSRYTFTYLSETISFVKSINRFSNTVLATAIRANESTNRMVAQSLFSMIRGFRKCSFMLAKVVIFIAVAVRPVKFLIHLKMN